MHNTRYHNIFECTCHIVVYRDIFLQCCDIVIQKISYRGITTVSGGSRGGAMGAIAPPLSVSLQYKII